MATEKQRLQRKACLKPYKPGECGNPGGFPKGDIKLTPLLRRELAKNPEKAQKVVQDWITGSSDNAAFLREMLDRLEGKVALPVVGAGGGPIVIRIIEDGNAT